MAAPTRIPAGREVYVPQDDFGLALSAAILKKHVPAWVVTDEGKALFVSSVHVEGEKGGQRGEGRAHPGLRCARRVR